MLDELPLELLRMVLRLITSRKDLKHLCEVSRYLQKVTQDALYEKVVISAPESSLGNINVETLLSGNQELLKHTRSIQISAPFEERFEFRRIHEESAGARDDAGRDADAFFELGESLKPLFDRLMKGQLQSFSWELGTCIPPQVMGSDGCLTTNQNCIDTLCLVTDYDCPESRYSAPVLSKFGNIRNLSWKGLSSGDIQVLEKWLAVNGDQLHCLSIDAIDSSREIEFAAFLLKKRYKRTFGAFNSLRSLELSELSLESSGKALADALNLECLRVLSIRNCTYIEKLLQRVTDSGRTARLQSFEIVLDESPAFINEPAKSLLPFLSAIQGLERFYISLYACEKDDWDEVARTLREHHCSTLKRLVTRATTIEFDADDDTDLEDREFHDTEIDIKGEFVDLLRATELEFLGICMGPTALMYHLPFLRQNLNCKVLHIRAIESAGQCGAGHCVATVYEDSGSDGSDDSACEGARAFELKHREAIASNSMEGLPTELLMFAQSAFGTNGLKQLRVIAYAEGDFRSDEDTFLCRLHPPDSRQKIEAGSLRFRKISASDINLWDLVDIYSDSIGSCTLQSIMM